MLFEEVVGLLEGGALQEKALSVYSLFFFFFLRQGFSVALADQAGLELRNLPALPPKCWD
jgi:hypothetical protein